MPYLVDGHNLIPKVPGISLRDPDDEDKLIALLQAFCQRRAKSLTVFFDRAPVGKAGKQRFGRVIAHYVRDGITADEAIMRRLQQLGNKAKNYIVVSSDRQVQQAGRAAHASVISSQAFAKELRASDDSQAGTDTRSRLLSPEEVAEWEQLFRQGHPPPNDRK